MRVRAVTVVDQLDRADERLVLLEGRAVRLAGLAPALLDLAPEWRTVETLAEELEAAFGAPPDGAALDLVRHAVGTLAAEGLVEIEGTEEE